jgi:hypothetical protein
MFVNNLQHPVRDCSSAGKAKNSTLLHAVRYANNRYHNHVAYLTACQSLSWAIFSTELLSLTGYKHIQKNPVKDSNSIEMFQHPVGDCSPAGTIQYKPFNSTQHPVRDSSSIETVETIKYKSFNSTQYPVRDSSSVETVETVEAIQYKPFDSTQYPVRDSSSVETVEKAKDSTFPHAVRYANSKNKQ